MRGAQFGFVKALKIFEIFGIKAASLAATFLI